MSGDPSFPACPQCNDPVTDVATTGPHTHFARPCGCSLSQADVQEIHGE